MLSCVEILGTRVSPSPGSYAIDLINNSHVFSLIKSTAFLNYRNRQKTVNANLRALKKNERKKQGSPLLLFSVYVIH